MAAPPTFNSKSPTIKRILKEATELSANPDPTLHAAPLESNLFEWHFTLQGPPSTPYSAGIYHGRIVLPPTYPLRPPSFRFMTPSGRFEVNREICLSISGHHEETWQPAWGIRTALWALRAFMEGDAKGQVGGLEMPVKERERLAEASRSWRCAGCGGRSNETILKEEGGEAGDQSKNQAVIPEELKFGFRDQMGANSGQDSGQVKAIGDASVQANPNALTTASTSNITAAGPGRESNRPPSQVGLAVPTAPPAAPQQPATPVNLPPAWIDKAITGVAAALGFMVLKKLAS